MFKAQNGLTPIVDTPLSIHIVTDKETIQDKESISEIKLQESTFVKFFFT